MAKRNSKKAIESNEPIQLNLAVLADYKSDIDDIKTVSIAEGKFQFTMNKFFRTTIIDEKLIPDIHAAFLTLKIDNVSMDEVSDAFRILIMCIFKNFSNLGLNHLQMNKEPDVRKLIAVMKDFYDKGLFAEIVQSIPEQELTKIMEQIKLYKFAQNHVNELLVGVALAEQEKINAEQELAESEDNERDQSGSVSEGTTTES